MAAIGDKVTISEAAELGGASLDKVKRWLRSGAFPHAERGPAHGRRDAPWLIPVADLIASGFMPADRVGTAGAGNSSPSDDCDLRVALARAEALAEARADHARSLDAAVERIVRAIEQLVAGRERGR